MTPLENSPSPLVLGTALKGQVQFLADPTKTARLELTFGAEGLARMYMADNRGEGRHLRFQNGTEVQGTGPGESEARSYQGLEQHLISAEFTMRRALQEDPARVLEPGALDLVSGAGLLRPRVEDGRLVEVTWVDGEGAEQLRLRALPNSSGALGELYEFAVGGQPLWHETIFSRRPESSFRRSYLDPSAADSGAPVSQPQPTTTRAQRVPLGTTGGTHQAELPLPQGSSWAEAVAQSEAARASFLGTQPKASLDSHQTFGLDARGRPRSILLRITSTHQGALEAGGLAFSPTPRGEAATRFLSRPGALGPGALGDLRALLEAKEAPGDPYLVLDETRPLEADCQLVLPIVTDH